MLLRSVLRALAGPAVLAPAVHAQSAPAPAPAGQFFLGGGLDPLATGQGFTTLAVALQAGYERRLGTSHFGLRVEGDYWHRATTNAALGDDIGTSSLTRTVGVGGVNLFGTYRFAPAARVRPYAFAGLGYQRLSEHLTRAGVAAVSTPQPDVRRANSLGYGGGFGLDVPLGRASLFVEGRFMELTGGNRDYVRGPIQDRTTPLTVGFRF